MVIYENESIINNLIYYNLVMPNVQNQKEEKFRKSDSVSKNVLYKHFGEGDFSQTVIQIIDSMENDFNQFEFNQNKFC